MSSNLGDSTRIEDGKRQNDTETDLNKMPDIENRDMITNEVNNKAQEPEMHKEIPTHDEGNKTEGNNNMTAKDEQEGATDEMKELKNEKTQEPEMHKEMPIHDEGYKTKSNNNIIANDEEGASDEMKEPKNDKTQEPEMHKEMPIHDGNKIKGNDMIAKDKERAADEMKEPKNDTTQNIKQMKKTKENKKIEKTQKSKGKTKKGNSTKKGGEDNAFITYPCSVCNKGVGGNSCQCNDCDKWCHLKCSELSSLDDYTEEYKCPRCARAEKKRGPGRPRLMTLTLEQEMEGAIRTYAKGIRRIGKPKDSKKSKGADSNPCSKKPTVGDEKGDDEDEDTVEDEEEEVREDDKNEENVDEEDEENDEEDTEIVWQGLKNNPDNRSASMKTKDRKRKTTEKEGLPEKVSPMRKINKVFEKANQEEKPMKVGKTNMETAKTQISETLTTIEGVPISLADRRSLDYGKRVTCTIISLFMKQAEIHYELEKNKILLLQPAMVQFLQLHGREDVKEQKKQLNMENYDWIFFPVSDRKNTMDGDGGSHFSLVIFNKKDRRFLHFDPIKGLNKRSALELMTNLLDSDSVTNDENNLYRLPDFEEAFCTKQRNGFDCGPYIIGYMEEAIDIIMKGNTLTNLGAPANGAQKLRNDLAEIIDHYSENNQTMNKNTNKQSKNSYNSESAMEVEEGTKPTCDKTAKLTDEKNDNNRKQNTGEHLEILEIIINEEADLDRQKTTKNDSSHNEGSKNSENNKDRKKKQEEIKTTNGNSTTDSRNRQDTKTANVKNGQECKYFVNDSCKYGNSCRYKHTITCRNWKRNGRCGSGGCTFNHPEPCIHHLRGTCQRRSCWYLHTLEKTYPKRDTQQEKTASMNKQQKHEEGSMTAEKYFFHVMRTKFHFYFDL